MIRQACTRSRRGSLLVEISMATVLLMIAMTLTVKVVGYVAAERRVTERRQRALVEVANLMERITAHEFPDVTPELAGQMALSPGLKQSLPDSELKVDVASSEPAPGRQSKRIAIRLRWRERDGGWTAPVRLSSWIEQLRPDK
jgi:hypothetical protein